MKHCKLPHIDLEEYYQFVTFRTYHSLDDYLEKMYNLTIDNRKKQMLADEYLDRSSKGAYLNGECIDKVKEIILAKDGQWYEITALAVMPNHIHCMFKQLESLGKIMKYIKAKTAIELNRTLGMRGQFWADDYYDRAIRDEVHFATVYRYILHNPLKAGLDDADRRVYSRYE